MPQKKELFMARKKRLEVQKNIKRISKKTSQGVHLFFKNNGSLYAASSAFYSLFSMVPFILLLSILLSRILRDSQLAQEQILKVIKYEFIHLPQWIITYIEGLLLGKFDHLIEVRFIPCLILFISSLVLFRSIIKGVYIIAGEKNIGFGVVHYKSIMLILLGIIFFVFLTVFPPVFVLFLKFLDMQELLHELTLILPRFGQIMMELHHFILKWNYLLLVNSNVISVAIVFLYITLFYRHIFLQKLPYKDAAIGALSFIVLYIVGKSFFWVYLLFFKNSLFENYGNFYTFIIYMVWIYFIFYAFYLGASIGRCPLESKRSLARR